MSLASFTKSLWQTKKVNVFNVGFAFLVLPDGDSDPLCLLLADLVMGWKMGIPLTTTKCDVLLSMDG